MLKEGLHRHNAHQQHSVSAQAAPTNGLFCLCYDQLREKESLGYTDMAKANFFLHFLGYQGD